MENCRVYPTPVSVDVKLTKDMSPKTAADLEAVRHEQLRFDFLLPLDFFFTYVTPPSRHYLRCASSL